MAILGLETKSIQIGEISVQRYTEIERTWLRYGSKTWYSCEKLPQDIISSPSQHMLVQWLIQCDCCVLFRPNFGRSKLQSPAEYWRDALCAMWCPTLVILVTHLKSKSLAPLQAKGAKVQSSSLEAVNMWRIARFSTSLARTLNISSDGQGENYKKASSISHCFQEMLAAKALYQFQGSHRQMFNVFLFSWVVHLLLQSREETIW